MPRFFMLYKKSACIEMSKFDKIRVQRGKDRRKRIKNEEISLDVWRICGFRFGGEC